MATAFPWYVYDAGGQRVRKVTERQAAVGQTPKWKTERIYLGSFEIYREYGNDGASVSQERETLHLMDDKQRIALIETTTIDAGASSSTLPSTLIRYQLGNHLGSAVLELDDKADVISYEEYYPYGSTSYQSGRRTAEVSLKRYQYTGKERDEENGFYYHGARYYAPWLGRWTSCDPGIVDTQSSEAEAIRDIFAKGYIPVAVQFRDTTVAKGGGSLATRTHSPPSRGPQISAGTPTKAMVIHRAHG